MIELGLVLQPNNYQENEDPDASGKLSEGK